MSETNGFIDAETNGSIDAPQVKFNFKGKRALVTGVGRGIGRGIAIALVEAGAETYGLSKTQANLDSLAKECPGIKTICVDLSDWSATRKAVESIGPIDFLVNNAGLIEIVPILDIEENQVDSLFAVNLKAVINITQVVVKGMIARSSPGSIVNVSSQASKHGFPGISIYCATKGALDQMTRCMALEFGPHKIRVNSIHPTLLPSDMGDKLMDHLGANMVYVISRIPLGRILVMPEVVGPTLYLLSDLAAMVTGHSHMVDGGFTAG